MNTNPKHYQLNSRTLLQEVSPAEIAIVKRIKSRIIRKDAEKIVAMAGQIKAIEPELKVSLICNDNICSKSIALLAEEGLEVRIEN